MKIFYIDNGECKTRIFRYHILPSDLLLVVFLLSLELLMKLVGACDSPSLMKVLTCCLVGL